MKDIRNDKNLQEAVNRREQQLKPMPADLNERLMRGLAPSQPHPLSPSPRGEGERLRQERWLKRRWYYGTVAIAAGIALFVVFNYGKTETPQEPLVAQQTVNPTAAPTQPGVEMSQPEVVADEQSGIRGLSDPIFDKNGITEPSPDSQEPTATEKVEEPRHFTLRSVIDITSPKDEPYFLASTSYMGAPKSVDLESGDGSAIHFSTKMASQNRPPIPQAPSVKDNFHKLTKKERKQMAVLGAIDMKRWHIDINSMNTMRYGSRAVTPDFFLELRGDTLRSYLPYLGQAQVSQFSPSIGLNFEEPVLSYEQSMPKSKKYTRLDIDVKTREDSYHYVIEIYDSGDATIRVRSLHRDPISFDGTLDIEQ